MKGFMLFAGDAYYPIGGWSDYIGAFPTLEEALEAAANRGNDWWEVVSLETLTIVKEGNRRI